MTRLSRLLATWGNGQHGRLGHGPGTGSELFPRVVTALAGSNVLQVACGGAHTAVVTEGGCLWTFGINTHGQLGHSEDAKYVAEPVEVILPDAVVGVAAGEAHTLALTESGEVWAAGSNGDGQLGLGRAFGDKNFDFRLVKALKGEHVVGAAAGQQHSLALTRGGAVFSWGHGGYGQLGLGLEHVRWEFLPMPVRALQRHTITSIAAGGLHSGCVDKDSNPWLWGHGGHWQLGLGHNTHECLPQQLQALRLTKQLCLGAYHSIAVGNFGQTASWGTDEFGSLGQGFKWPMPMSKTPERLPLELTSAAAGWKHSAGVGTSGQLYTWGWGGAAGSGGLMGPNYDLGAGQLGLGEISDEHEPRQVQRLLLSSSRNTYRDLRQRVGPAAHPWRAVQVSCGRNHTAAVVEVQAAPEELG